MIEAILELLLRALGSLLAQIWLIPTWTWSALALVLGLVALLKSSVAVAVAAILVVVFRLIFAWLERQASSR